MAAAPKGAKAGRKTRIKPQQRRAKGKAPRQAKKRLRFRVGKRRRRARASHRRPYDFVVSKMLQQLHRDRVPISAKGKGAMISYVRRMYNKVSSAARCRKRDGSRCVIGLQELQAALQQVMPKEGLKKSAVEESRGAS